jgi:hypothetical protein
LSTFGPEEPYFWS